jgi:hypothetical protein
VIDPFEARLADLVADRLGVAPEIDRVTRARDGLTDPAAGKARLTVQVLGAQPSTEVGDDTLERQPDGASLRPVLRLAGAAQIAVAVAAATGDADQAAERATLLAALDRLLVALHDGTVRDGSAFATGVDQGFALDGFRLEEIAPPVAAPDDFHRVVVRYSYSGRFWPLTPAVTGDRIRTLPTRLAVLPFLVTDARTTKAGQDLSLPIALELHSEAGATAQLTARLLGASPVGQLVGATAGLPPGSVGYSRGSDGRFTVVYRPPATVAAPATVRIAIALSSPDRPTVALGELAVVVQP